METLIPISVLFFKDKNQYLFSKICNTWKTLGLGFFFLFIFIILKKGNLIFVDKSGCGVGLFPSGLSWNWREGNFENETWILVGWWEDENQKYREIKYNYKENIILTHELKNKKYLFYNTHQLLYMCLIISSFDEYW